jgi:DinB superfamily
VPTSVEDPRYPIGQCIQPETITRPALLAAIATIAETPGLLRRATADLSESQIDTPYREGGWTVRQLIHHVADSHTNAVIRVHLALTEDWPTVKPYDEAAWAQLQDSTAPIEWSLSIIQNVHARWVMLLNSLDKEQWQRGFNHPERGPSNLERATLLYDWHSRHHLAHITQLRLHKGW